MFLSWPISITNIMFLSITISTMIWFGLVKFLSFFLSQNSVLCFEKAKSHNLKKNKNKTWYREEIFLQYFWPLVSINSLFRGSWPFLLIIFLNVSPFIYQFSCSFHFFHFKIFICGDSDRVFWFKSCSISTVTLAFFSFLFFGGNIISWTCLYNNNKILT